MEINKNNYEVFFLDFFDGNLSSERKEELFSFLAMHPDLQKEFSEYESITLGRDIQIFENKTVLKRFELNQSIDESNFEQFCIAWLEGDLSEEQRSKFLVFVKSNPVQEMVFNRFQSLKLHPPKEIVYFGKDKLKRGSSVIPLYLKRISVAASILLVAGFTYLFIVQDQPADDPMISEAVVKEIDIGASLQESILIDEVEQEDLPEAHVENIKYIENRIIIEYDLLREAEIEDEKIILENIPSIKPRITHVSSGEYVFASIEIPAGNNVLQDDANDFISNLRINLDELAMAVDTGGIDGSGRISIWDIAGLGINGIGKLTGADIRMEKKRDEEGNVTALAFQSRNLNFTKKIND